MQGKLSPKKVVRWIDELLPSLKIEEKWHELSSIVQQIVLRKTENDDLSYEMAELESLSTIEELLRNRIAEAGESGQVLTYELDETESYIQPINHGLLDVKNKIQKLDPKKFEELCAEILKRWGMERAYVTGDGFEEDGGIDFIGYSDLKKLQNIPFPSQANFAVLGQSKKTLDNNKIKLNELRHFVGSASLRIERLKREGKIKGFSPVILAFWTSSSFHEHASNYSKEMGIWALDGMALADYVTKLDMTTMLELQSN
jgi:restriction endonuclease Mrr